MRSYIITVSIILTSLAASAQIAPAVSPAVKTDDTNPANTIVFVNSDSLLNNYDYYKDVKAKMQTLSQQAQTEIATKGQAFQKEVAAYQKSASSLTPMQKAATEKRLAKKQQDLQTLGQNTNQQLQEEEANQNSKLYDRISAYLKTYTKLKGYKIVLTYSKANPSMLYGDDSLDVTKEVVAGLNDEYKKEGK
ncbi:MAG: OmpH family outer membrane protein [Mucilaginibacter sp.]|nr:OmpH family outer membrane protein [Mucilaginibacter sp.]